MLDLKTSEFRIGDGEKKPRVYAPAVQPLMQSLLGTLADLDFDYERERERVTSSAEDPALRSRLLHKLEERHRRRREPYMQRLTMLQARLMPAQNR